MDPSNIKQRCKSRFQYLIPYIVLSISDNQMWYLCQYIRPWILILLFIHSHFKVHFYFCLKSTCQYDKSRFSVAFQSLSYFSTYLFSCNSLLPSFKGERTCQAQSYGNNMAISSQVGVGMVVLSQRGAPQFHFSLSDRS